MKANQSTAITAKLIMAGFTARTAISLYDMAVLAVLAAESPKPK